MLYARHQRLVTDTMGDEGPKYCDPEGPVDMLGAVLTTRAVSCHTLIRCKFLSDNIVSF